MRVDEQELKEMLSHDGMKPFLAEIEKIISAIEADIIKCSFDGLNPNDLIIRKAKAMGARQVMTSLVARVAQLKK